jgi:hypothetical protein
MLAAAAKVWLSFGFSVHTQRTFIKAYSPAAFSVTL